MHSEHGETNSIGYIARQPLFGKVSDWRQWLKREEGREQEALTQLASRKGRKEFVPPGAKHLKGNILFTLLTLCSSPIVQPNRTENHSSSALNLTHCDKHSYFEFSWLVDGGYS